MPAVFRPTSLAAVVPSAPLALLVAVLLTACGGPDGNRTDGPTGSNKSPRTTGEGNATVNRGDAKKTAPVVRPDEMVLGRVTSANPSLRFVVMDFPIRRMPAREQRLNVYRDGQKIGEIKVTGPAMDTTIAGDIVTGEAQIGDEVRED